MTATGQQSEIQGPCTCSNAPPTASPWLIGGQLHPLRDALCPGRQAPTQAAQRQSNLILLHAAPWRPHSTPHLTPMVPAVAPGRRSSAVRGVAVPVSKKVVAATPPSTASVMPCRRAGQLAQVQTSRSDTHQRHYCHATATARSVPAGGACVRAAATAGARGRNMRSHMAGAQ